MRKGPFKIRANSEGPSFEKQEKIYRNFIRRIERRDNPDLLTYFGNDFFHDGNIENFRISDDFKTISFRILCPNIRKHKDRDDWDYVNAWFKVTFQDVAAFKFESYRIDKLNNPLSRSECCVQFMGSEINSLKKEIQYFEKVYKQKFKSLIIDTLPTYRTLEIVFSEISVEAEESLAFSQLLANENYDIPLYKKERN